MGIKKLCTLFADYMFTQSCLHSSTCLLLGTGAYLLSYSVTLITDSRYTLLSNDRLARSHLDFQDLTVSTISRTPFKQGSIGFTWAAYFHLPIRLITLPYFLYIEGIYPVPVKDKKSKLLVYRYTTFVWSSDYIIV